MTKRATVLVLGDLGRSPRMLNHARSLVGHGWTVTLVGFAGAPLPADLAGSARVRVRLLADGAGAPRPSSSRLGSLARLTARGATLAVQLAGALPPFVPAEIVLVQNPPGIPTLPLAWLQSRLSSSRLIVDWHNLTSSMLRLTRPASDQLAAAAGAVECWIGRRADVNLFVSAAMAARLESEWGLEGFVFRDRPPMEFAPLDPAERREVRHRLLNSVGLAGDERDWTVVLSPTSWTADEDFQVLTDALRDADARIRTLPDGRRRARVLVLASGRGALRERFERTVASSALSCLAVRTAWFEPGEYSRAVAASDCGLCLHRSASGLDLPMKIVDFFGSGVPVLALDYGPCLREAVAPGINGLLFHDSATLSALLVQLVTSAPALLEPLRRGAVEAGSPRWDRSWNEIVLPLVG